MAVRCWPAEGLETSTAAAPPGTSANVTNKFLLEAAAKAVVTWGVAKVLDYVWDAVTDDGDQGGGYVYKFVMKTSCNDGASTNGGVAVKITDTNGNWLQTDYLDNDGINDRELCAVDGYETESQEMKVLLNDDTVCRVYFNPVGENPKWEPEYIKISRTKDDKTYSATFCNNNGVLADEGWYTFDFCS